MTLLRVLRRVSAARIANRDEFCEAEFWSAANKGPDQQLSVYRAPATEAVRIHAEHSASAGMNPPRDGAVLNVFDGSERAHLVESPREGGYFAMTDAAHMELHFGTPEAVREYAEWVRVTLAARRTDVARHALRDYARERLAANDAEWVRFVETSPKGSSWR